MPRWIEATVEALVRRMPSRFGDEAGEGDLHASREGHGEAGFRDALREALEGAWLGAEALLAGDRLARAAPRHSPAAEVFASRARCIRGHWPDPTTWRDMVRTCRAALAEARRAEEFTPSPEELNVALLRCLVAAGPDEIESAHERASLAEAIEEMGRPGLSLVSTLTWGGGPLLPVLAEALLLRALGDEPTNGHRDEALMEVAATIAECADEVRSLLDAARVLSASQSNGHISESTYFPERNGHHATSAPQSDHLTPDQELSALLNRAAVHRREGHHEQAIADFTEALALTNDDPETLAGRAAAFRLLGRLAEATHDLEEALSLDPENPAAHFEMGMVLRDKGDPVAAERSFGLSLECGPAAETHYQRGLARTAANLAGAEDDFADAAALDPEHDAALLELGRLRIAGGDLEGGIADLTDAIEAADDPTPALLERAPALATLGHLDQAMEDLGAALERRPTLTPAWLMRGKLAAESGVPEQAEADFTRALEIDPTLAAARLGRGECAARRGASARALADFTEAIRLDPKNARAYFLRGTLHGQAGRHLEALGDLHQAALLDPVLLPAYYGQRAQMHLARGEYGMALADTAIGLRLDPSDVTAMQRQELARDGLRRQQESAPPPQPAAKAPPPRRTRIQQAPPPRRAPAPKTHAEFALPATGTHIVPRAGETQTMPIAAAPTVAEDAIPAPEPAGATAPDEAVPPPDLTQSMAGPVPVSVPVSGGPFEARINRDMERQSIEDRARRWDHANGPPTDTPTPRPASAARKEPSKGGKAGWLGWAAALLLIGTLGAGVVYGLAFLSDDPRLDAEEAWEEYAKDSAAANNKYKGRFVKVSGVAMVRQDEEVGTQVFFKAPGMNPSWLIEVPLPPAELGRVTDGKTITVRGRFNARKGPNDMLLMSNCTLTGVPGG